MLDSFTIDEALAKAKQLITASSATLTLADIMNKDGLNVCAITAYLTDDNPPEWVPVVKILRVIGETPETISALNESEAFEFISTVITARRTMISRTNALLGQHHSTKDVGLERVKTGLGQLVGAQQQPKSYYGDYESTEHVHEEGDY